MKYLILITIIYMAGTAISKEIKDLPTVSERKAQYMKDGLEYMMILEKCEE